MHSAYKRSPFGISHSLIFLKTHIAGEMYSLSKTDIFTSNPSVSLLIRLALRKHSVFRNPAKQFAEMHYDAKTQFNKFDELQLAWQVQCISQILKAEIQ
ncbi:MAG: hypothetical protein LUO89_00735 [Methanothrix sp.]|nr:hypothetical protein [Methanothrix sp.]